MSRSMNRRNFLKIISLGYLSTQAALLTGCTHKRFYNPDQDIILGGGRFKKNDELHHVLAVTNFQQKEVQLIEMDFMPHGIIIDPRNKKRIITFEKNGSHAAEINLDNLTVMNLIQADDNKSFGGHGTFDKSGDIIYCVETDLSNNKGTITIRDSKNLSLIDEMPSFGHNPHQCLLTDDYKTLLVSNTGSRHDQNTYKNGNSNPQASVTYIDVQNKRLLERVMLTDTTINVGHIALADDESLIVGSAPNQISNNIEHTGGISIRNNQQSIVTMTQPEVIVSKLIGEALSISIDERHNIVAVTHPAANLITFWSVGKKQLVKAISVHNPRGITLSLDRNHFLVSYGTNTSVILVDTKTLAADTETILQPTYTTGEHIVNWSRTLTEIMPTQLYT